MPTLRSNAADNGGDDTAGIDRACGDRRWSARPAVLAAGPAVLYVQWACFATGANPLNMQFSEGFRMDVDR